MSDKKTPSSDEADGLVATETRPVVKRPSMYKVILLNDDFTPMDFVVWLLTSVFFKTEEEATRIMLEVHQQGQGICGIYPFDVARTKINQVRVAAEKNGHPLQCVMDSLD